MSDQKPQRAVSAGTKYSNTPESDAMTHVMHTVTFEDGSTKDIMATDPMDAIRIANIPYYEWMKGGAK